VFPVVLRGLIRVTCTAIRRPKFPLIGLARYTFLDMEHQKAPLFGVPVRDFRVWAGL